MGNSLVSVKYGGVALTKFTVVIVSCAVSTMRLFVFVTIFKALQLLHIVGSSFVFLEYDVVQVIERICVKALRLLSL